MEVVWIALIVFGFAFLAGLAVLIRFPEEVRSLIHRTESVQIGKNGIAWTIFEEAIRAKEHREPTAEEIEPSLSRITRGRILWVDDSPANNRLETQLLRALGVEVDTATSNGEALQYAATQDYDLVLSDIGRPPPQDPEAGLVLPQLLREAGQEAQVAYYTGHAVAPETPGGQPVFDAPSQLLGFVGTVLNR